MAFLWEYAAHLDFITKYHWCRFSSASSVQKYQNFISWINLVWKSNRRWCDCECVSIQFVFIATLVFSNSCTTDKVHREVYAYIWEDINIIPNLYHALNTKATNEWTYEPHTQRIQMNKQRNQYNSKALKLWTGWPCYNPIRQCPFWSHHSWKHENAHYRI